MGSMMNTRSVLNTEHQRPRLLDIVAMVLACFLVVGCGRPQGDRTVLATWSDFQELQSRVQEDIRTCRPAVVGLYFWGNRQLPGGGGSGVIISANKDTGTIVTCGHAGKEAGRKVTVFLDDERVFIGRTLGQLHNRNRDIGLIEFETHGEQVPVIPLADSKDILAGQWVVVLGHTHGRHVMNDDDDWERSDRTRMQEYGDDEVGTLAEIELRPAIARVGRITQVNEDSIRFDAPINTGDSGGAVVNLDGQLVGIAATCGIYPHMSQATNIGLLDTLMPKLSRVNEGSFSEKELSRQTLAYDKASMDFHAHRALSSRVIEEISGDILDKVVSIECDHGRIALGTVVRDNLVLTKDSCIEFIEEDIRVITSDGRVLEATRIGRDPEHDLAILEVPGLGIKPVEFDIQDVPPGTFVLSVMQDGLSPLPGWTSLEPFESSLGENKPYLGIRMTDSKKPRGSRIEEAVASTPAAHAGLQEGDVVVRVNETSIESREDLRKAIETCSFDETTVLEFIRDGNANETTVQLGRRPLSQSPWRKGHTATRMSKVGIGLGRLIPHDTKLRPNECGSPLMTIDGDLVGINVGRQDRSISYALDALDVVESIERMMSVPDSSGPRHGPFTFTATEQDGEYELNVEDASVIHRDIEDRRVMNIWDPRKRLFMIINSEILLWHVDIEEPGTWEIDARQGASSNESGMMYSIVIGDQEADCEVFRTKGRGRFEQRKVGTITIKRPGRQAVLLVPAGTGARPMMNLDKLILRKPVEKQD